MDVAVGLVMTSQHKVTGGGNNDTYVTLNPTCNSNYSIVNWSCTVHNIVCQPVTTDQPSFDSSSIQY